MKDNLKNTIRDIVQFLRRHISRKNEDLPFYILIFFSFSFFVIGINVFIELTEEVQDKTMRGFDRQVTEYITSYRTPELNQIFTFITDLGDVYAYVVAVTIVIIFFLKKFRSWKFILELVGVLILATLSNIALKRVFNRARPMSEHLVVVESLSYPSGHAMSAMAFYGFLIYLVFRIKMSRWLRTLLALFFAVLILLIGISRIYLGVHFPSDVVGGFLAGLIWVAFCIILFNVIALLRQQEGDKDVEEKLEE